jgi:hypothetical protein
MKSLNPSQKKRQGTRGAENLFFTVLFLSILFLSTLALAFGSTAAHSGDEQWERNDGRVKQGFAIAPVLLDLRGENRALVGLAATSSMLKAPATSVTRHPPMPTAAIPFSVNFR